MLTMFDRTIFIGDIHSSKLLSEFVAKANDGRTFFVFLGDLFDRGQHSVSVFETVKTIVDSGKGKLVLGNHCIDYVLGFFRSAPKAVRLKKLFASKNGKKGFERLFRIFERMKGRSIANYGDETDLQFRNAGYSGEQLDWLFFNGKIFQQVGNSACIHGGIPILPNGTLVGHELGTGTYSEGIEYVKKFDDTFHELEPEALELALAESASRESHVRLMEIFGYDTGDCSRLEYSSRFVPHWAFWSHSLIGNNESVVRNELSKIGCVRLFAGHLGNYSSEYGKVLERHWLFPIDRSGIFDDSGNGNFGYAILENVPDYVREVGDAIGFLGRKRMIPKA